MSGYFCKCPKKEYAPVWVGKTVSIVLQCEPMTPGERREVKSSMIAGTYEGCPTVEDLTVELGFRERSEPVSTGERRRDVDPQLGPGKGSYGVDVDHRRRMGWTSTIVEVGKYDHGFWNFRRN